MLYPLVPGRLQYPPLPKLSPRCVNAGILPQNIFSAPDFTRRAMTRYTRHAFVESPKPSRGDPLLAQGRRYGPTGGVYSVGEMYSISCMAVVV